MSGKTQITAFLGDNALVLPGLIEAAILGNEQAKYVLGLLQMAVARAQNPDAPPPDSLRADREACGIVDPRFDRIIRDSDGDGRGNVHIPGLSRLIAVLDQGVDAMLAPFRLLAGDSSEAKARLETYAARLDRLRRALPAIEDDLITDVAVAAMSSGRPAAGDGFHVFIMDLHKELNALQAGIATETVEGATAYGITEADRVLVAAFMRGVGRTAPLKFDHPGLATAAARTGEILLIQNDIGTTDAHVLVVRVTGLVAVVAHTDIHVQRLRFFQDMLTATGIGWQELDAHQNAAIAKDDLFYVAHGRYEAPDAAALAGFLERLGSRLVFLIDWNRARKRLRLLVPNETAVAILRWAAEQDVGHRGFLSLGAERLVYDALEQAVHTPLRYGEPLYELIGTPVAQDYLCYVLQRTTSGLLAGQSEALIRDEVRAELLNHFHSAEQRLLAEAGNHAAIIQQLAAGLRAALRNGGVADALKRNAVAAKLAESRADEIVQRTRLTVRRIPGTETFRRILELADDAADELEDSAFLAGLLADQPERPALPPALLGLADALVEGAQAFQHALAAAQTVRRGGAREKMQDFLEAIDRLVTVEHQTDEGERAVTAALLAAELGWKGFHLVSGVAAHLESAADALLRAGLTLRDHVLGDVMAG